MREGAIAGVSFAVAVLIGAAVALYNRPVNIEPVPVLPDTSRAPPVAGPPCIHEVCGERPRFLNCVYTNGGSSPSAPRYCARWAIEYEHHCDCDRWGP